MQSNHQRRQFLLNAVVAGMGTVAVLAVAQQPAERIIKVTSKQFAFTPNRIELKKNEPVVLELTALDVPMGFNAPDFHVRADMVPGTVSRIRLTPDKTGEFTFLCDVFCGSGHEDMNGTIVVT
jgi:cytochrome c oxidase subunit 2